MTEGTAQHFKRLRGVYRSAFHHERSDTLSPAGVEILANLRAVSGYGQSPFRTDALTMAYHVGMQDIVRHILMMLNIPDEEIYRLTMMSSQTEGSFSDD